MKSATRDESFPDELYDRCSMVGVAPSRLIIEIIEHAPAWNQAAFLHALEILRGVGIRIALDDIGQGDSNYRMIIDARPEYLKIDRYFCHGITSDSARRAVVTSVVQLARDLGSQTVAEGVETQEDFILLRDLGVDFIQGYLFYRPLIAEKAIQLVESQPDRAIRRINSCGTMADAGRVLSNV